MEEQREYAWKGEFSLGDYVEKPISSHVNLPLS
jgi:hypothetical protein